MSPTKPSPKTATQPEPSAPSSAPRASTPRGRLPGDSPLLDFWDSLKGWHNGIFLLVFAALAFAASRVDAVRPWAAKGFSLGFPVAAVLAGFWALREGTARVKWLGGLLGIAIVLAAELTLAEVWFPPPPLGTVTLTEARPDGSIDAPAGLRDFEVQARGKLLTNGAGRGEFALELSRAGRSETWTGAFERLVGAERRAMRRQAPTRVVQTHEVLRRPMHLDGSGPVRAKLVTISGGVHHAVRLTLAPLPATDSIVFGAMIALVVLALALEVYAARQATRAPITAGAVAAAVLAVYYVQRFDPDDPLTTFWGGAIVALLAGVVGGAALGKLATGWLARPAEDAASRSPS